MLEMLFVFSLKITPNNPSNEYLMTTVTTNMKLHQKTPRQKRNKIIFVPKVQLRLKLNSTKPSTKKSKPKKPKKLNITFTWNSKRL